MSAPPFLPPVPMPLHPKGWPRPATSTEFRVTQMYADVNPAISKAIHGGMDMGNGHLGAPLFSPALGVVIAEGWLLGPWSQASTRWPPAPNYGGVMVVIDHGTGYISALAHMARTTVNKGQTVTSGQPVGNLGATGAAKEFGGHVHWDLYRRMQLGESSGPLAAITYAGKQWRKVDPWPLLIQNYGVPDTSTDAKEDDMQWRKYAALIPLTRLTLIGGTIPYKGPGRSYGEHSAGYAFPDNDTVLTTLEVELPDRTGHWFACDRRLNGGGIFWVPNSGIRKAEVIATDASTQQDAADAFRARIDGIKSKVAALAADVAND